MITLLLTSALTALMIIWMSPAAGVRGSSCEQYPRTAGCR